MKAKAIIGLVVAFVFFNKSYNQNLVFNGNFEQYLTCPTYPNFFCGNNNLPNWICASATPDYFNACANLSSYVSVPDNFAGYQYARSGVGYTGIAMYGLGNNYREFIQEKLDTTLLAGNQYCVIIHLNFADTSYFAINKFGTYFSDTAIVPYSFSYGYPYLLPFSPQVQYTGGVITDTVNWIEVSGIFTAQGNENYITLGNFEYDSLTTTVVFNNSSGWQACYYYIDDVSVEEVKSAEAVNDGAICRGDSIQLGNNTTENASYVWQPGIGLSDSTAANPKAAPSITTTYYVTKTQCSVVTTDSVTITVNDCSLPVEPEIFIPSAFSPNGDGQNDILFVRSNKPVESLEFNVYDRIGELVFSTTDINKGWDGTFNNQKMNNGVFFYYCKATIDGKELSFKGDVTLVQ
jgi:gliding motility-associated-like protein